MMLDMETHEGDRTHPMPDHHTLQAWVKASLDDAPHSAIKLSISNVPPAESQRLNKQYRAKDYPTNVLSFPIHDQLPDGYYLGDIICCGQVIEDEAKPSDAQNHWAHMIIHGMLHLQDHTHEHDEDSAIMMTKETNILAQFGIPDPYQQEK